MLRIRGHHLLCILGFRGKGYDSAFVENMGRVADAIQSQPDLRLTVCDSCDDICGGCPHGRSNTCHKHQGAAAATRQMDRAVLSRLKLRKGETVTVNEAYQRVADRIEVEDIAHTFCTECEWRSLGFCDDGLRALKEGKFFDTAEEAGSGLGCF